MLTIFPAGCTCFEPPGAVAQAQIMKTMNRIIPIAPRAIVYSAKCFILRMMINTMKKSAAMGPTQTEG